MASSPNEAKDLITDLNFERLQQKYAELLKLHQDSEKQAAKLAEKLSSAQAQSEETDSIRQELENLKREIATTQTDASTKERKNAELISSTNNELLETKNQLKLTKDALHTERVEKYKISAEKERSASAAATLKLTVESLQSRLESLTKKDNLLEHELNITQSQFKEYRDKTDLENERLTRKLSDMTRDNTTMQNTIDSLRYENKNLKSALDEAKRNSASSNERCETLELDLMASSKENRDIVAEYERQLSVRESFQDSLKERLAHTEAQLEKSRQDANKIQTELNQKLSDVQVQLAICREKFMIFDQNQDQTQNPDSNNQDNEQNNNRVADMITMIKRYEDTGRQWSEIFNDFFSLRNDYIKATAEIETLRCDNDRLIRNSQDMEQWKDRERVEIDRLRHESARSDKLNKEYKSKIEKNTTEIRRLETYIREIESENESLRNSLTDCTYQLRFLLQTVQLRGDPLPASLDAIASDIISTCETPVLDHKLLVFKNIDELLESNKNLTASCRKLSNELQQKISEYDNLYSMKLKNEDFYKTALQEAKSMITELEETAQSSKSQLSLTTEERDYFKHKVEEYKKKVSPDIEVQLQENEARQQQWIQEREENEVFNVELKHDVKKVKSMLEESRKTALSAQRELSQAKATISHLEGECTNLNYTCQERQTIIFELREKTNELQERLAKHEDLLQAARTDVSLYKRNAESLREQNIELSSKNEANAIRSDKLSDHIASLTSQYETLSNALANITLQHTASAEGAGGHADYWKARFDEKSRELESLTDKLANAEKKVNELQSIDHREWQDKCLLARGELQQLTSSYDETRQQLDAVKQEKAILEMKLADATAMTAAVNASASSTQESDGASSDQPEEGDDANKYRVQLAEAEGKIKVLESTIADYHSRLAKERRETAELNEKYDAFVKEIQTSLDQKTAELNAYDTQVKALQKELEAALVQLKDAREDKGACEQKWTVEKLALVSERDELLGLQQAKTIEIESLQKDVERHRVSREETNKELKEEHARLVEAETTARKLKEDIVSLKEETEAANLRLAEAEEKVKTTESNLKMQKEYTDSIVSTNENSLNELQKECESLTKQIENLVSQIAKTDQSSTAGQSSTSDAPELADQAIQGVFEVNAMLRQSKEALETRYNESQKARLKLESNLEYTQRQLSHARKALDALREEKETAMGQEERVSAEAKNLVAVYKDSNDSLRTQLTKATLRVETLEKELDAKTKEMEPMSLKIKTLEAELAQSEESIAKLEKMQTELVARSTELMSRHNVIDPEELKQLQKSLEDAKASLVTLEAEKNEATTKAATLETEKNTMFERLKRTVAVVKHKEASLNELKAKLEKAAESAQNPNELEQQNTTLTASVSAAEQALKVAEEEKKKAEEALKTRMDEFETLDKRYKSLLSRARLFVSEKNKALEELRLLKAKAEAHDEEMNNLKAKITENEALIKQLNEEKNQKLKAPATPAPATAPSPATETPESQAEQENLKTSLAQKEKQLISAELENKRLKAMQSMMANKNSKLGAKVAELTAQISQTSSSTGPAGAPTKPLMSTPIRMTAPVPTPKPTPVQAPQPVAVQSPKPVAVQSPKPVAVQSPKPVAVQSPKPVAVQSPQPVAVQSPQPVTVPTFAIPTNVSVPTFTSTPEPTPVPTPTPTPALTPVPTPPPTLEPTLTHTPEPIQTPTPTPVPAPTAAFTPRHPPPVTSPVNVAPPENVESPVAVPTTISTPPAPQVSTPEVELEAPSTNINILNEPAQSVSSPLVDSPMTESAFVSSTIEVLEQDRDETMEEAHDDDITETAAVHSEIHQETIRVTESLVVDTTETENKPHSSIEYVEVERESKEKEPSPAQALPPTLVSEPVSELAQEPISEPVQEPVSESVHEPVSESAPESVPELASEPASEPEPESEPVPEPASEPASESASEPVPESAPDVVGSVEPVTEEQQSEDADVVAGTKRKSEEDGASPKSPKSPKTSL